MLHDLARVRLGHWPTPIEPLDRLSRALGGPQLYVKRDDLSGLASGGNKTRKLELLVADALRQGATTLITCGAAQSNHARQTAAAAAHCGLRCLLVLDHVAPPSCSGNLLLDRLLGAQVRWAGDRDVHQVLLEAAQEEVAAGRVPYVIPLGGSNAIGAAAYVLAVEELVSQQSQLGVVFDHIVLASGSGGTQAGLEVGAQAMKLHADILGISVAPPSQAMCTTICDLAQLTAEYLALHIQLEPEQILVNDAYLGAGYGTLGDAEREAIRLVARTEGLLLDPVYTGRAMAGLLDLVRKGRFARGESVLFWHTGGTAALYAYADALA